MGRAGPGHLLPGRNDRSETTGRNSQIRFIKRCSKCNEKFNKGEKPLITTREILYEHGKNTAVDQMAWKEGTLSYSEEDKRNNGWNFLKIEEVLPPTAKTLDEARGYVIADYQDKLEQEWIKELSATYKIKVNQSAFQNW